MIRTFVAEERKLKREFEVGKTIVVNQKRHHRLIAWAKKQGVYEPISRGTRWGNPYVIGIHGDRKAVCDLYGDRLKNNTQLREKIPTLKGKILGCWCYPEQCHGQKLIEYLEKQS